MTKHPTALVRGMFEEQINWATDAKCRFYNRRNLLLFGEARIALKAIKESGLPAVVTLTPHREGDLRDEITLEVAAKQLEQDGATVVGINCARGPQTMLPAVVRIRQAVSCHVAALPVPYRTTADHPTMQSLRDPRLPKDRPFPTALDPFTCNRYEMAEFAREAYSADIRYLGVCCGGAPHHVRAIAEALGRKPEASRYSPDMSRHYAFGTHESLKKYNLDNAKNL